MDERLAELLAKCAPVWVPAEDQGHLHAMAARDAALAREDVALAYCARADEPSSDTMPCGCESGSCYCDTIDRDWDAYEARDDARDCDGYPL